jgi:transcriptional regulator with XRE-family HTH domain
MLQMKKENHLKSLLGLTQEEAAMLFNITRIQWAQFSTGRREIPATAKLKLAEVLTALKNNKKSPTLTTQLLEIEKKKALDKKIIKIQQVRGDAFKALEVANYLESQKGNTPFVEMASFIQNRVKNTLKKNSLVHLQELELKKESLEMLKSKITKKLKM